MSEEKEMAAWVPARRAGKTQEQLKNAEAMVNRCLDRVEALRAENERLRGVLRDLRYPCTCDPAYYERGLVAPDCMADLCGDDAREALGEPRVCRGAAALREKIARAALDGD